MISKPTSKRARKDVRKKLMFTPQTSSIDQNKTDSNSEPSSMARMPLEPHMNMVTIIQSKVCVRVLFFNNFNDGDNIIHYIIFFFSYTVGNAQVRFN